MDDITHIYVSRNSSEVDEWAGGMQENGYTVLGAGPSNMVLLRGDVDNGTWDSGTQADWFVAIATKSPRGN